MSTKIHKRRGVTLASVLTVVAIISILTGMVTISTSKILKDTQKRQFLTEINLVKTAVKDYIKRNSEIIDFEIIEFDLTTIDDMNRDQFNEEIIVNNKIEMFVIDLEKIGVYNAKYGNDIDGNSNDKYVISKEKGNVYYLKGFDNKGYTYYKYINE